MPLVDVTLKRPFYGRINPGGQDFISFLARYLYWIGITYVRTSSKKREFREKKSNREGSSRVMKEGKIRNKK
jgi:hypothetical protein